VTELLPQPNSANLTYPTLCRHISQNVQNPCVWVLEALHFSGGGPSVGLHEEWGRQAYRKETEKLEGCRRAVTGARVLTLGLFILCRCPVSTERDDTMNPL
jgi:hypothetical protein